MPIKRSPARAAPATTGRLQFGGHYAAFRPAARLDGDVGVFISGSQLVGIFMTIKIYFQALSLFRHPILAFLCVSYWAILLKPIRWLYSLLLCERRRRSYAGKKNPRASGDGK